MTRTISTYTQVVVNEALARGINVEIFTDVNPFIAELKLGKHIELIYQSNSNLLGYVTFKIFANKAIASTFLKRAGFKVPAFIFTDQMEDIIAFLKKYKRIVIKPVGGVQGKGVTPGITGQRQITEAVELVKQFTMRNGDAKVVCQEHVEGQEYRLLVIDKRHLFAVQRFSARVVGDGKRTVEQLLADWNNEAMKGRKIKHTASTLELVREQGLSGSSIPDDGETVILSRVANAFAGGTVKDVTDRVGEPVRLAAVRLAEQFDAAVVGIDCIGGDISSDIGYIIELNSMPDLLLHHFPTVGAKRNPSAAIVDMLFPETVADSFDLNGKAADKSQV